MSLRRAARERRRAPAHVAFAPPATLWNDDLCTIDASAAVRCVATTPPSGGANRRPRDAREELLFDREVREVSAGLESLCARRTSGEIECVRRDRTRYAVALRDRVAAVQLATSLDEHCALSNGGVVSCWRSGALAIERARPVFSLPNDARDPRLRAGFHHLCIAFSRAAATEVWCWGDASIARTGTMPALTNEPTRVALPGPAVRIDDGPSFVQRV